MACNDWLARKNGGRNITFYYARSKIATDVSNDKHENGEDHNEKSVLDKTRESTMDHLKTLGMNDKVFLIDNHFPLKYDFAELEHTIINNLSELKRHAMVLTLSAPTQSLSKVNAEELRKRVPLVVLKCAAVKLIAIPEVGIAFDAMQMTSEI